MVAVVAHREHYCLHQTVFFLSVVLKKNHSLSTTTDSSRDFARVLNKVGNIFPYIVYLFASPPPLILRRLLRAIKTNHHGIFIFYFSQLRIENT